MRGSLPSGVQEEQALLALEDGHRQPLQATRRPCGPWVCTTGSLSPLGHSPACTQDGTVVPGAGVMVHLKFRPLVYGTHYEDLWQGLWVITRNNFWTCVLLTKLSLYEHPGHRSLVGG